jgi:hypothetical protein
MISICLVNTYDKLKLHEIHLRSIARAAPLCYAFNFHLVLLYFDFWKREDEMIEAIRDYTTIGHHGKYAVSLLNMGRVHLIDKLMPQFGITIATTSRPDPSKVLTHDEMKRILRQESAIFLLGLGRKGLGKDILKRSRYHFDATGQGISLETCTAMGVVSTLIYHILQ